MILLSVDTALSLDPIYDLLLKGQKEQSKVRWHTPLIPAQAGRALS